MGPATQTAKYLADHRATTGPESDGRRRATFRHQAPESTDAANEWEMERDQLFVTPKYLAYAQSANDSDLSMEYGSPASSQWVRGRHHNTVHTMSQSQNEEHSECKKEAHDAYERGFLAGYFLGVNVMQQHHKEKHDEFVLE